MRTQSGCARPPLGRGKQRTAQRGGVRPHPVDYVHAHPRHAKSKPNGVGLSKRQRGRAKLQ